MISPFFTVENFISPLKCEELVKDLSLAFPNRDASGTPLMYEREVPELQRSQVFSTLGGLVHDLENHFGANVSAIKTLVFQQFFENPNQPAQQIDAKGWKLSRKKWIKTGDFDLVGFIWLKDYNSSIPLDPRFEVYGGTLEFPSFDFSLLPDRGTLVVFPATPHFLHAVSHILCGTLEQLIVTIKLKDWSIDSSKIKGTYSDWFA